MAAAAMSTFLEHLDYWRQDKTAVFHEQAIFTGLWTLVGLVGVNTMGTLRYILEPLIWAFFLMMALLPLADLVECCLLRLCAALPAPCHCLRPCGTRPEAFRAEAAELERQYSGISEEPARPGLPPVPNGDNRENSGTGSSDDRRSVSSEDEERGCGCLRMVASLVTMIIFVGAVILFIIMIYRSAYHMQSVWVHYEQGAQRLLDRLGELKDRLPEEVADKATKKVLQSMEVGIASGTRLTDPSAAYMGRRHESDIGPDTSCVCMLQDPARMLLYMVFWLCNPVFVGETVTALFKRYILLKTIASAMYAFFIYLLLQCLAVDLAIVFGLVSFVFNFIPEVGPIAAMFLPLPVILLDGRLERPLLNMFLALGGQFCLKFVFANIIEVKLVERQNAFRMHPVTILFFIAFFGRIWGATGMLVSVPMMAAAKAAAQLMPALYRDPILVFLEGDKNAPARFKMLRQQRPAT